MERENRIGKITGIALGSLVALGGAYEANAKDYKHPTEGNPPIEQSVEPVTIYQNKEAVGNNGQQKSGFIELTDDQLDKVRAGDVMLTTIDMANITANPNVYTAHMPPTVNGKEALLPQTNILRQGNIIWFPYLKSSDIQIIRPSIDTARYIPGLYTR